MNSKRILLSVLISFGFIFLSIPVLNHYFFRTSALDLGVFNHALYNYAHLRTSYFTLGLTTRETGIIECFGNHFSPLIFLLTPFYFIFGTYTLSIIQVLFILFGGLGIYKYARERIGDRPLVSLFAVHFFCIWGIYSALAFDFHMNVIAAMLVPWLFYYHKKENISGLLIIFTIVLLSRENMSLWLAFLFTGILADKELRSGRRRQIIYLLLILLSVSYFILTVFFVMPKLVPYESAGQLSRYIPTGETIQTFIGSFFNHPQKIIDLVFRSSLDDPSYKSIKTELHIMILMAGGALFLIRPAFLIMLLPIYLQKLLSNDPGMWGINYHYSIEFVPVLSLLLIETITTIKEKKLQITALCFFLISTISSTGYTFFHRESTWYDKAKTCFFCPEHFQTNLNLNQTYRILKSIPAQAAVSSYFSLAPHLAYRGKIYHYPVVKDAEYIVLLKKTDNYYPLSEREYRERIQHYRVDPAFEIWRESEDLIVFKRKKETHE